MPQAVKIAVHVKPGSHRDGLWRDPQGLFVRIRAAPHDGAANAYLVRYLAGCLRVAPSRISILRGHTSPHKLIQVAVAEADLQPILDSLPPVPQLGLFDSE